MKRIQYIAIILIAFGGISACGEPEKIDYNNPKYVQSIYRNQCASCHQQEGAGIVGLYPPLANSEWVTGSDTTLVKIVLNGMTGEMEVAGERYKGAMPSHKNKLRSEDIRAILNYVRTSWGNQADSVSLNLIDSLRQTNRNTPWTADELKTDVTE